MANGGRFTRDLLDNLLTLRVEMLMLGVPPSSAGTAEGRSRGPLRRVPPTNPNELLVEVANAQGTWVAANIPTLDRESGLRPLRTVAATRDELDAGQLRQLARQARAFASLSRTNGDALDQGGDGSTPERELGPQVDPDVAARAADALDLVTALLQPGHGPTAEAMGPLMAESLDELTPRDLDHCAVRELARYWELGSRPVWYRTTMGLDGDIVSGFRIRTSASRDLERSYATIVAAAIAHWQLLILGVAIVMQALAVAVKPRRLGRMDDWERVLAGSNAPQLAMPDDVKVPGLRELARRAWRLFALGRVVFESGRQDETAMVRTVLHPGGDIETSVRFADLDRDVLREHVEAVTRWLSEVGIGFQRLRTKALRVALVVGAVPSLALLGWTRDFVYSAIALAGFETVSMAGRWGLRRHVRRKLLNVFGHAQDGVEMK